MKAELDHARQENTNLAMNLKEKSRKLSQTEELYSKIKRQAMLEAIDHTASHVLGHNLEVANARLSGMGQSEYNQQATHQQHQMYNHGNSPGYNQQPQPHISSRTNPQQSGPSLGFGSNTYRPAQPPHNPSTGIPPIPTPLGQRPRFPGALAAVHGVVAGTPRATPRAAPAPAHQSGSGGIRQPYLDPGQIARNPPRFTGGSLAGKPQGLASSRHAVSGAATEGYNRGKNCLCPRRKESSTNIFPQEQEPMPCHRLRDIRIIEEDLVDIERPYHAAKWETTVVMELVVFAQSSITFTLLTKIQAGLLSL